MTREEILAILVRWNLWGSFTEEETVVRECLSDLKRFASFHGIIAIKGPRRAGKSTLLFQLMEELTTRGDPKRLLYINFEDYALSTENLRPDVLESILDVYQQEVYHGSDFILFLDEVQNVVNWDKWLRTLIDSRRIKTAFITGSSSKLLSGELASLLTGRHVDFELLPFSFKEYVLARGFSLPDRIDLMAKKNLFISLLKDYMIHGGFPEVVKNISDEVIINKLLLQYAEDMILKDVMARFGVVNIKLLKYISKYLAQNIGNRISIRKVQRNFESSFGEKSSTTTISNYISYLETAYLVFEVPHFDYSVKRTIKEPAKYYMVDTGLRNVMFPSFTPDMGRLLENVVYLKLRNMCEDIFYWKRKNEVDFVCKNGSNLRLYNVTYVSSREEIDERELKGLVEFPHTGVEGRYLITWNLSAELEYTNEKIKALPAYVFLLGG